MKESDLNYLNVTKNEDSPTGNPKKSFFIPQRVLVRSETTRRARFNVLLKRIGRSQNWLANEVGVSKGTMSHIANGLWFPASDVMTRICKLIEVPSHVLFGDSSHWKHYNKKMKYLEEDDENIN